MKRLSITTFLFLIWTSTVYASNNQYQLQVGGLACPFCAYGIEKKLIAIDGVDDIKVDVTKGTVIVTMTEGKPLTESRAREQIKKAGFSLRSFTHTNNVN